MFSVTEQQLFQKRGRSVPFGAIDFNFTVSYYSNEDPVRVRTAEEPCRDPAVSIARYCYYYAWSGVDCRDEPGQAAAS